MTIQIMSKGLGSTASLAGEVWGQLEREVTTRTGAVVLGLRGDLGSGKTTFTQALAKAAGVETDLTSPTFVLAKRYPLVGKKFENLIHLDCYRLESPEEILSIGWEEWLVGNNLLVVEWPEKIEKYLPTDILRMDFEFIDENTRKINLPKFLQ